MVTTANFNIPKPDPAANVDDEFYRLVQAWDIVDSIFFTIANNVAGKAAAIHKHVITDVDGLTQALANKMSAAARFSLDDLTNVSGTVDSALGYVLAKTAAGWEPISPAAAIGAHQHVTADIIDFNQKVDAKISALVGGAPGVLDTLSEIATAMGNDPNLRTTLVNMIAGKLSTTGGTLTGALTISMGGPQVNLVHTNGQNRRLYHDGASVGFLNSGGGWLFRGDDSGAIWTSQLGDINSRIEQRASDYASAAESRANNNTENRARDYANDRVANLQLRWVSQGNSGGNLNWEAPGGAAITGYNRESGTSGQVRYLYYRYLQMYDNVRGWVTSSYQ